MAEYNLGTAHGTVKIDSDVRGLDDAKNKLGEVTQSGQSTSQALEQVGNTMGVAGLAVAGGLGVAVATAADFQAQLSGIQAVSGATTTQMEAVHDAAMKIGQDTKFSASEAAQAMEELVKAGIPIEDVLNGAAQATTALAAATGVDMPTAAAIASNAMNVFGIQADEMDRVVNTFAQTANASAIDITDLGMSMQQVGAVADLAGLSMEDTTRAIGQLGDAGIAGSDAGTSLKTMLMNLQPSTEAASNAMRELGIITEDGTNRFYDQEGNLKSLRDIQQILNEGTKDLTAAQKQQALETIFGSDAIRAAAVLAEGGAEAYDNFGTKMEKSGTAAEQAKIRQDNMKGSLEQLKGALENAGITIGEVLIPPLTTLIEYVQKAFDWFSSLPGPVQTLLVYLAAGSAAFLLLGSGIIKAVGFISELKGAIGTLIGALTRKNAAEAASAASSQASAAASSRGWLISAWDTIRLWAMYAAEAVKQAAVAAGAWIAQTARATAATVSGWATAAGATLAHWGRMVAMAVANAASVAAAWIAQTARTVATTVAAWATMAARSIAQWAMMAGRATVSAAIIAAQWLVTTGASMASSLASLAVAVATTVASWVAMAATAVANAVIIAAQWFIALGPVGWAIAALIGLAALVVIFWDDIKAAFQAAVDFIAEKMQAMWTAIQAAWDWIVQKFQEAWQWITDIFASIGTAIQDAWNSIIASFQAAGQAIWNALQQTWQWIQDVWNTVLNFFRSIPGWISDVFTGAINWLVNFGSDILTGLWNGAKNMWNNVIGWVRNIGGWVKDALSNAGQWLLDAGRRVVEGLWNGIQNAASWLWDRVTGWASGIVDGVLGALGINSPSKYTTYAGEMMAKGLAMGMEDSTRPAVQAAVSMAQQTLMALQKELDNGGSLRAAITTALSPGALAGLADGGPTLGTTLAGMASGTVPASATKAGTDAAFQKIIKMEFKTYNPVPEMASDSEARQLRAGAAVGAF